jgi:alpha 1,6-mannosyltransferase
MTMYRNIFQTDKRPPGDLSNEWAEMNKADGWVLDFYTDERAQEWVDETFADDEGVRSVKWAYDYMKRGVLKADFLRYLLPLVKGGVYSDTDVSNCQIGQVG